MSAQRATWAVCYVHGMAVVDACRLPVDGGDAVFCEVTGQGPPLVLTHDAILHRETWDAQFASLSRLCRVVRWDRRGYGLSDEPSAPYASDDDLACVIAGLLWRLTPVEVEQPPIVVPFFASVPRPSGFYTPRPSWLRG